MQRAVHPEDMCYDSVEQLGTAYRRGHLSPVSVVAAHLERIRRLDGELRAYITVAADQAIWQAAEAARELREGRDRGPLHGVPFAVKDQLLTGAIRSTAGSCVPGEWSPDTEATPVTRLREAGAILLGKLNMAELALGNPVQFPFGTPRNPWNLAHETGGSSNGAGSATAAGMATFTLGADTVGSVRVPAAYCGVVGLRPTSGLVSRHGTIPVAPQLDTVGPIARTVADVALVLGIIAGPDPMDEATWAAPMRDYRAELEREIGGVRASVVRELLHRPGVAAEVERAFWQAVRVLEQLGVSIGEVSIPLVEDAGTVYAAFGDAEAAVEHVAGLRRRPRDYGREARVRLATGMLMSAAIARWADRVGRAAVRAQVLAALEMCDLLITPAMPTVAPRIGAESVTSLHWTAAAIDVSPHSLLDRTETQVRRTYGQERPLDGFDLNRPYIAPFALAGIPSLVVCCGFSTEGLPLSLQIAGQPFEDALLLRVGHAYQRATSWHTRRPGQA